MHYATKPLGVRGHEVEVSLFSGSLEVFSAWELVQKLLSSVSMPFPDWPLLTSVRVEGLLTSRHQWTLQSQTHKPACQKRKEGD